MLKNKFRLVTDTHAGYEVQIKFWWFPFIWFQISDIVNGVSIFGTNTHSTIEAAERFIVKIIKKPSKMVMEVDIDELLDKEDK